MLKKIPEKTRKVKNTVDCKIHAVKKSTFVGMLNRYNILIVTKEINNDTMISILNFAAIIPHLFAATLSFDMFNNRFITMAPTYEMMMNMSGIRFEAKDPELFVL